MAQVKKGFDMTNNHGKFPTKTATNRRSTNPPPLRTSEISFLFYFTDSLSRDSLSIYCLNGNDECAKSVRTKTISPRLDCRCYHRKNAWAKNKAKKASWWENDENRHSRWKMKRLVIALSVKKSNHKDKFIFIWIFSSFFTQLFSRHENWWRCAARRVRVPACCSAVSSRRSRRTGAIWPNNNLFRTSLVSFSLIKFRDRKTEIELIVGCGMSALFSSIPPNSHFNDSICYNGHGRLFSMLLSYRCCEINIFRNRTMPYSVITFYENDENHLNQAT